MTRRGTESRAIAVVRGEIEEWRRRREKRTAMPARLWEAAARLAKEHGVYRVSQALRVNYDSLKRRVPEAGQAKSSAGSDGFVELGPVGMLPLAGGPLLELDLSKADGSRMSVRMTSASGVDVGRMVEGFWSSR